MSKVLVGLLLVVLVGGVASGATVGEQVGLLFDRALEQIRAGEKEAALATAREAVRVAPGMADAWMIVGNVRRERGDLNDAVTAFQKATRLAPGRPMPWVDLGWTYYKLGDYEKMERASRQAVKLGPDLAVAWRDLATAQWNLGKLAEAEASFRQALRLDPYNGRYRAFLSGVLAQRKQEAASAAEFEAGMEDLHNQMADAYLSQAWTLQDFGNMAGSAQAAAQVVRMATMDETRAAGYNVLAYAQMYSGNLEAAQKSIAQAMKLAPKDPYYQDTAAILALLRDDLAAAEKLLTAAMAQEAAEEYVSPTLALLWARQGKREQALGQLTKIEAKLSEASIPDDYYLAGKTYLELGDKAKARELFAAGAKHFPRHPWGEEMGKWVEANP
ncbi:MAG: tetratricopeptide repeat protein [Armatimonadia bacterium]